MPCHNHPDHVPKALHYVNAVQYHASRTPRSISSPLKFQTLIHRLFSFINFLADLELAQPDPGGLLHVRAVSSRIALFLGYRPVRRTERSDADVRQAQQTRLSIRIEYPTICASPRAASVIFNLALLLVDILPSIPRSSESGLVFGMASKQHRPFQQRWLF